MGRELSEEDKCIILQVYALYPLKWTLIGAITGHPESTVRSFVKSYHRTRQLFPKRGPKPTITEEQKKDVVDITINMPEVDLYMLQDIVGISHTSCKTILNENDIHYTKKSKKTPLTNLHKNRRIRFCNYWSQFRYPLPAIIFTDESTVMSDRSTRGIWRLRGFQHPDYYEGKVQHPLSVMVWGGIGPLGFRTPLIWCRGNITAQSYITMLQQNNIIGMCRARFGQFLFQQDNAPAHSSRLTKRFLATRCQTFEWPSKSPDLSPIEQLWDYMKGQVEGEKFRNEAEMFHRLAQVWLEIPAEIVHNAYSSFLARCKVCASINGDSLNGHWGEVTKCHDTYRTRLYRGVNMMGQPIFWEA